MDLAWEGDHTEDLNVDSKIILKLILKEWGLTVWIWWFMHLTTGSDEEFLQIRYLVFRQRRRQSDC